jgi:hypothetical protein
MLANIKIENLLFFDIETVSQEAGFENLDESSQGLWQRKHQFLRNEVEGEFSNSYQNNAAIYAEFGKIVCISCGFFVGAEFRVKSFYGENEQVLLQDFSHLLESTKYILCGHNIKEFDVPYICRRMLINQVPLPRLLDIAGKKPWEVDFVDSLQLWKFGDFKAYTSLNLLANIFKIPTPKDDIDGSQVGQVFWQEKDLDRIVIYCQKDVVTVARLIQRWKNEPLLTEENLKIIK